MTLFFDVHKNALENLSVLTCAELWSVLCKFEGTSNIFDGNDREELLLEAQAQVDRAYSQIKSDKIKRKLFLIKTKIIKNDF